MSDPLIIGITGGSGSGKSYFVNELLDRFNPKQICLVTQDNYYRDIDQQPRDEEGVENFDLPESIDHEKLIRDVKTLKQGNRVEILEYTFNNKDIEPKTIVFNPSPILIVEGLMAFYWEELNSLMNYRVFIDAEDLIKVKRRIIRDAKERGYDLDDVLYRYEHHVAPFYHHYLEPVKKEVDIIVPNNTDCKKGVDVVEGFIRFWLGKSDHRN